SGDFESAVKWQEEAIRLGGGEYSRDFHKRLRSFKAGKPYREGMPPFQEMIDETTGPEQPAAADVTDAPNTGAAETPSTEEQPN
ncbi:MAG: hypothetical protein HYV60_16560, partial [Planctomycetia bacterium]|nr:hypothetical protein [Planctomycetia bacterium]